MTTEAVVADDGSQTPSKYEDFSAILRQTIAPATVRGEEAIDGALAAIVQGALEQQSMIVPDGEDGIDPIERIQQLIGGIDEKLSRQMDEILHHKEFQTLEGAWLGLAYTLNNSRTGADLTTSVLNVSKDELREATKKFSGAKWDQSPLTRMIYEKRLDSLGEHPFSVILGDYYFDQSGGDVSLLRSISKIAEASLAPFIAAASPKLLGQSSWNNIKNVADVELHLGQDEYAAWNGMRKEENSRFVALTMPRVLARAPYDPDGTSTVKEFEYIEKTDGHAGQNYAWMNAAHAMGVNINRAFKTYGWTANIRGTYGGGVVEALPMHQFDTGLGQPETKCPTEISIDGRLEHDLSKAGLLPLLYRAKSDQGVFQSGSSLYQPQVRADDAATASDELSAKLPYMMCVSRFAHYLKAMMRDRIGSAMSKEDISKEMQQWVNRYVLAQPVGADEKDKARKPLAAAKVELIEDELRPGNYSGKFFFVLHHHVESIDLGIGLVSKIPGKK